MTLQLLLHDHRPRTTARHRASTAKGSAIITASFDLACADTTYF